MKAVVIREFGGPEVLEIREVPPPELRPDHVLVRVRAAAVNRADVLQRKGLYPPPAGVRPDIPGLEYSGEVETVGERVREFHAGDRVMGLLPGEGYSEQVSAPEELVMPIPGRLSWVEAAAVPEVFATAFDALLLQLELKDGERILIHAAASGVGTAAVQLARRAGAEIFGTAGSDSKLDTIRRLGCHHPINYRVRDFEEFIGESTGGTGVDAIADLVGGSYWEKNLRCLSPKGRLILIGLLGGSSSRTDLGLILRKRLRVTGTVLRSRGLEEKAELTARFRARVLPLLGNGELQPVVDRVFPLAEASEAHRYMEANRNVGKIVLNVMQASCL